MENAEILSIFDHILRDLLLDDSIQLAMETRREDVSGWDSFNYINFIVAVEGRLKVRFKIADIEGFSDVGGIVTAAQKLLSASRAA